MNYQVLVVLTTLCAFGALAQAQVEKSERREVPKRSEQSIDLQMVIKAQQVDPVTKKPLSKKQEEELSGLTVKVKISEPSAEIPHAEMLIYAVNSPNVLTRVAPTPKAGSEWSKCELLPSGTPGFPMHEGLTAACVIRVELEKDFPVGTYNVWASTKSSLLRAMQDKENGWYERHAYSVAIEPEKLKSTFTFAWSLYVSFKEACKDGSHEYVITYAVETVSGRNVIQGSGRHADCR